MAEILCTNDVEDPVTFSMINSNATEADQDQEAIVKQRESTRGLVSTLSMRIAEAVVHPVRTQGDDIFLWISRSMDPGTSVDAMRGLCRQCC